ncbi:MAG: RNase adapter RapZ [Burkholderiaceae bacterium]
MKVVVVTGISGSGKSIAVKALEDQGYYCIDNLPLRFLQEVVVSLQENGLEQVAVAIDARSGDIRDLRQIVQGLSRFGHDVKVIFLNSRDDVLVHRYSESRRRHPLALSLPPGSEPPTLIDSITGERELMADMLEIGAALDTSDLHPNSMRQWLLETVQAERTSLTLVFQSFAFKYGIPLDADLVFDVRCLPNPHYDANLRPLTGRDEPVQAYFAERPVVAEMLGDIERFLERWLPSYMIEQRSYLTVSIGCTGGQHRSVYCVEKLAERFRDRESVLVRHRGIEMRRFSPITTSQSP